ncbi:hypothetical protein TWF481_010930 [Arthrobotrys musiformis]|uniref:Uncharacterized protein n=1 Tax=Arthrobotrys musiformis TaxID=47236 RepID=A0AAV9W2X3_9PEZI
MATYSDRRDETVDLSAEEFRNNALEVLCRSQLGEDIGMNNEALDEEPEREDEDAGGGESEETGITGHFPTPQPKKHESKLDGPGMIVLQPSTKAIRFCLSLDGEAIS